MIRGEGSSKYPDESKNTKEPKGPEGPEVINTSAPKDSDEDSDEDSNVESENQKNLAKILM